MRTVITISRHWDHPKIQTSVSNKDINLEMELDDFVTALKREIGSVTWIFRDKTFSEQIEKAKEIVLSKVKEETIKVV
jgi:hypothetical protein